MIVSEEGVTVHEIIGSRRALDFLLLDVFPEKKLEGGALTGSLHTSTLSGCCFDESQ